jgi:hypothetical protein
MTAGNGDATMNITKIRYSITKKSRGCSEWGPSETTYIDTLDFENRTITCRVVGWDDDGSFDKSRTKPIADTVTPEGCDLARAG